ncbi:hypothetical protein BC826DRAFT_1106644 [Russula brevipes]|nr:hypothetical protein BC826DRAFT_1106644 [Russula brevipes]
MAAAPVAQVTARSARRRALLIGIAYRSELPTTHQDVDQYQGVLIVMYGYRPEDITSFFPAMRSAVSTLE